MLIGILSVAQFAARYSGTTVLNPLCWFKNILTTDADGKLVDTPIPKSQYTVQAIRYTNVFCSGSA